jgi:hypothetical protein
LRLERLRAESAKARLRDMLKTPKDPAQLAALEARQYAQAERLERLRAALGITQTAAAKIAGVSIFKWHRMEAGQHPIDPLALQIFCDAHKIGADYVITAKLSALEGREGLMKAVARLEMQAEQQYTPPTPPRPATPPQPQMPQAEPRNPMVGGANTVQNAPIRRPSRKKRSLQAAFGSVA